MRMGPTGRSEARIPCAIIHFFRSKDPGFKGGTIASSWPLTITRSPSCTLPRAQSRGRLISRDPICQPTCVGSSSPWASTIPADGSSSAFPTRSTERMVRMLLPKMRISAMSICRIGVAILRDIAGGVDGDEGGFWDAGVGFISFRHLPRINVAWAGLSCSSSKTTAPAEFHENAPEHNCMSVSSGLSFDLHRSEAALREADCRTDAILPTTSTPFFDSLIRHEQQKRSPRASHAGHVRVHIGRRRSRPHS